MKAKDGYSNFAVIIFSLLFVNALGFSLQRASVFMPLLLLMAVIVFIAAFIRTNLALIVLIFSMLLSPEFKMGGITGRAVVLRVDDVFIIVVFLGWLAKMAINKEFGLLKTTSLNKPILAYIFISILATLFGALQGHVRLRDSFFYLLKYFEYFILFFMVANNLRNMKQAKTFVYLMFFVCFLVSVYGFRLYLTGTLRITAPFEGEVGEANTLAGYLLLMMAVIGGLILHSNTIKQKVLLLALIAFVIPPFLFTLSRGAWLGFFPMYLTLILLSKRGKIALLVVLLAIVISAPLITPQMVKHRVEETFIPGKHVDVFGQRIVLDDSAAARILGWREALKKMSRRPFLGYGVPGGVIIDNQYARILIEVGLIGFIIFIWLMVMILRTGWDTYITTGSNNFAQGLSLGFIAGFVGLLTQAITTETFIIVRIMEPFWFLAAIVVTLPELITSAQKQT